jgi:predicted TIM-barrel fold metal-dependent hydrolase
VIIDFHTHIFPPWIKRNRSEYIRRDPCFSLYYSDQKAKIITAEELITHMDENEIDQSIVLNIGWVSQDLCIETNDYILEAVSHYSNRLVAFCAIQPTARDAAIIEMLRCAEAGAKGLGEMRSDIQGFNLADKELIEPLVNEAVNNDLIFLTHSSEPVGHDYAGKGNITPTVLYNFIQMFPALRVVCAHWGGGLPFYALIPEVDDAFTNVYFDTAATIWLYRAMIFQQVCSLIGSDKILFGSDYPLVRPSRIIAQIQASQLGNKDQANILGGNAWKLLYREPKESNGVAEC